ncbi:hypothetical protein DFH28DRAFT_887751 [Melampsora americana]|nr:hypothetical protein DFH28DRAFT_887751 [Melampsora americana]
MGKSGKHLALPGASRDSKQKVVANTPAALRKAENDKSKIAWGKKRCEELRQALNPPPPDDNARETEDEDNDGLGGVEPGIENHESDNRINHDVHRDPHPEPMCLNELVTGDAYRNQRIRENAEWKDIMPKIFIAYMSCLEHTSNWGNAELAFHNFNNENTCSCSARHKRTRPVDTVDLLYRRKINVEFCSCTPDQVRLINQGYLGGTPKNPETAFSLRLLRFYHTAWKYCHSNIQPFSLMIDEFLDAYNPLILVPGTYEPRLWRKPLIGAVYCYRQLLKGIEVLEVRGLQLTPLEQLAANCPRCFGPPGASSIQKGPQYVVCVDGNFQQRRQESATEWEPRGQANRHIEVPLDPCTQQHTAAADKRTASSWKGCEETGLVGMACRHDHMLKMVNVIRSGERYCDHHFALKITKPHC